MSLIHGEYWIRDGQVDFADGDVGEANHEGIAMSAACRELSDLCAVDYDDDSGYEALGERLVEYAMELGYDGDDPWKAAEFIIRDNGKDPDQYYELMAISLSQSSQVDPREYAMKHWGWIWCKQDWFGVYRFDEKTRKNLLSGILDILDEEGQDEEDDSRADATQLTINAMDGKRYYMTLRELRADETGSGNRTDDNAGPNAQLKRQDIDAQPKHYGDHLGDSYSKRRIDRLFEGD